MSDTAAIEALTRRIEALEDEIAIRDMALRYCFSSDSGSADNAAGLFVPDGIVAVDDAPEFMKGREGVRASVDSDAHKATRPNAAHVPAPVLVQRNGNKAIATGYVAYLVKTGEAPTLMRQSVQRWEMEKRDGKWMITRRESQAVGRPQTAPLMKEALR